MLVCLLALSVGQAAAQRCLPGMQAVEMRGGMAPSAGYFAGLGVTTHAKGGNRWVFGAEYLYRKHDYRMVTLPSAQFTAEGAIISNYYPMQGKPSSFTRECPHWPDTKR